MMNRPHLTLTILTLLTLAACGGGGGGGNTPTVHAPSTPSASSTPPTTSAQTPPTQAETPPVVEPNPSQPIEPSQPNPPPAVETPPAAEIRSDEKTFQTLTAYAPHQGGSVSQLLNISLNGKNIELAMVPPNVIADNHIETLRDKAGNLVGYLGYARVDEPQKDVNGEPLVPKLHHLYLMNASEALRQLPSSDMSYAGKMFYHHLVNQQSDGVMREAEVTAKYSSNQKTMNMSIHDSHEGKTWVLRNERIASASPQVAVNDNGSMAGFLFEEYNQAEKPKFNGQFEGGFYGENGSVLMGSAHYDGSDAAGTGKWQGVIGATAQ